MKMNIGPIKDIMDKMGISEEDLRNSASSSARCSTPLTRIHCSSRGAPTLPLFQGFGVNPVMQDASGVQASKEEPAGDNKLQKTDNETRDNRRPKNKKNQPKRKFLNVYCTDLTEKARTVRLTESLAEKRRFTG